MAFHHAVAAEQFSDRTVHTAHVCDICITDTTIYAGFCITETIMSHQFVDVRLANVFEPVGHLCL